MRIAEWRYSNLDNSIKIWYHNVINSKQEKTLKAVWAVPVSSGIVWADIESLFLALGSEICEGSGSRVRVKLNGVRAVFHRPHPEKTTDKGSVISVRRFLENAGVGP
ncbi:hexulose-6-phosphate isomerase [Spirochaetia bacterium]|nr:hexulose-6-phosphate isomerase [Spirochaetia bacterium]